MGAAPSGASRYHREVAAQKRDALVDAARRLFLDLGYDGTSLARVAAEAGVSRATLFKQFPTKAELFDAMVTASWSPDDAAPSPEPGTPRAGLAALGTRYVDLLAGPGMVELFRIVIAEIPRFPELGRTHFDRGKMPFFDTVCDYLRAEHATGTLRVDDVELAAGQFLGMISNVTFWPRLLIPGWDPGAARIAQVVDEAVETTLARYATA